MFEFLKDFTSNEVSDWIKNYYQFLLNPRKAIEEILQKDKDQKLRQFLFYFFVYAASFIFLTIGTSITDGIKPAILNIFSLFPIMVLFTLSAGLFSKTYTGKTLIYVLGFHLIVIPIVNVLLAIFFTSENYTYYYFKNIVSAISIFYLIIIFGFAIERKWWKAIVITTVNYVILNLITFAFLRVNFDPYSDNNQDDDLIYHEYVELVKPLKNKELIPTLRLVNTVDEKIETDFGLQEVISGESASGSTKNNPTFITDLQENIKHVEEIIPKLIFNRNKRAANLWLSYFKDVQKEANYKVKDIFALKDLKLKKMFSQKINGKTLTAYYKLIDHQDILNKEIELKWYHNSTLSNHNKSILPTVFSNNVILYLGYFLQEFTQETLNENKSQELKVKFEKLE